MKIIPFLLIFFVMVSCAYAELVGFYPFSGNASDASGYGHDGEVDGATLTTDINENVDSAYIFDGDDDSINTTWTDPSQFNGTLNDGFTLSAWIYPESIGETAGRIVDKATENSAANGFYWCIYPANVLRFVINGVGGDVSSSDNLNYNEWSHVVTTVNSNTTVTHYINGVVSGTPASTNPLSEIITTNNLTIGNLAIDTSRTFDGIIDELRIYNETLTQAQVTALYHECPTYNTGDWRVQTNCTVTDDRVLSGNLKVHGSILTVKGKVSVNGY